MPEYDVLPEIDSYEERQRLANIAKVFTAAKNRDIPVTKEMASVLAATGLAGNAAAQPDRDDQYPEVGLVDNRVDGWADGVDANATYARQLAQSVHDHGSVSGSVTLDPSDGNTQRMTVDGDVSINLGSVNAPLDGFGMSVLFESNTDASVTWDSSVEFGNALDTPSNLYENEYGILGLRTYDGGSSWQGSVFRWLNDLYNQGDGEDDWTGSWSDDAYTQKDSDVLVLSATSNGVGDDQYATFTHSGVDLTGYSAIELTHRLYNDEEASVFEFDIDGETYFSQRSRTWGYQTEVIDVSELTGSVQPEAFLGLSPKVDETHVANAEVRMVRLHY